MESKFIRAIADSPTRCQDVTRHGQCPYESIPGLQKCPMHAGPLIAIQRKEKTRLFRLTQYRDRVNEFADNDEAKSLREEIGMLRMMLEAIWNRISSPDELLMMSSKIADIILKIEKLVVSCSRLEVTSGTMLDRATVLNLATVIVNIVAKYVPEEDTLDNIGNEISDAIMSTSAMTAMIKSEKITA